MKLGEKRQAEAEFRKAVALEPQNAAAHNNEANALAQGGNIRDAIEQLQQALALQGDMAEAHHNLGVLLLQQGDQKSGQAEIEQSRKLGYTADSASSSGKQLGGFAGESVGDHCAGFLAFGGS